MAQKNATPSKEQQMDICHAGLNPADWVVVKDLMYSMIIRHRYTNEHKMIYK